MVLVVVVVVVGMQPNRLLTCARASLQHNVSDFTITEVRTAAQLSGGWSKGNYSSNAFCSCCQFFFWKSCSFLHWMKLLKIPFHVIWFDLLITQLCFRDESKHAAVVWHRRLPLSLAMEEMTWVALSCQNYDRITKCNSKYCSTYTYGAKLHRLPICFFVLSDK